MTAAATIELRELLNAFGFGLATVGVVTAGLTWISLRQRARMRSVATTQVGSEQVADAIARVEEEQSELLLDVLGSAAIDVGREQRLEPSCIRVALYKTSDRKWSLYTSGGEPVPSPPPPSPGPVEWGLESAVSQGKVVITVPSSAEESDKPKWTISLPVLETDRAPAWVLYVEGSGPDRSSEDLRTAAAQLLYYREVLELLLKTNASGRWSKNKRS
jgi:hypothetical protein